MSFSDRIGAQVAGSETDLLPQDAPHDTREAKALETAGAAIDTDVAAAFVELAHLGDAAEEALLAIADAIKALKTRLDERVAQIRAAQANAKAMEEAARVAAADQAQAAADAAAARAAAAAAGEDVEEAEETEAEEAEEEAEETSSKASGARKR
jgi:hypothetical protein